METTIENPVIQDEAANELKSQLRKSAEAADAAGISLGSESSAAQTETRAPVETDKTVTSSPDITPEKTEKPDEEKPDRLRDDKGKFVEKPAIDANAPKPEEKKPDKPETPYAKAQKDQERLNRNRQEFEEEKRREREAIAAEKQRLEQERQQWQQQRQQPQQNGQTPQYSSKEYSDYADQCTRKAQELRAQGDVEGALEQTDLAAKAALAAGKAREYETTAQYEQSAQQYEQAWTHDMQERIRLEPDLSNKDSELTKTVMTIMGEFPGVFERIPPVKLPNGQVMGGFSFAAEIAKLRLKAGAASGLEEENKQLKAKVAQLEGNLTLNGSGPTGGPIPQKRFEDMSVEEMKRSLRERAEYAGNLSAA